MATIPMLAICCVCKQVAEGSPSLDWTSMSTYLDRHHLQSADVILSHTYCPSCYERQARAWSLPTKGRARRTSALVR